MSKFAPIIVASFTLIGVLLGSWLAYYFQLRSQEEESLLEQRIAAYRTFYKAQVLSRTSTDLRAAGHGGQADEVWNEFKHLNHKARFELTIYGTGKAIRAITKYFRVYEPVGECGASRQKKLADLAIYQAMREELYPEDKEHAVSPEDLAQLLFLCELRPENEASQTN